MGVDAILEGPVRSVRALTNQDPVVAAFAPCEQGRALLETFAMARPDDYSFLETRDFLDLRGSAFPGIVEWDKFAEHVTECIRCGEA